MYMHYMMCELYNVQLCNMWIYTWNVSMNYLNGRVLLKSLKMFAITPTEITTDQLEYP